MKNILQQSVLIAVVVANILLFAGVIVAVAWAMEIMV